MNSGNSNPDSNPSKSIWDRLNSPVTVISGLLTIVLGIIQIGDRTGGDFTIIITLSLLIFLLSACRWVYSRSKNTTCTFIIIAFLILVACAPFSMFVSSLQRVISNPAQTSTAVGITNTPSPVTSTQVPTDVPSAIPEPTPTRPPTVTLRFESWKDPGDATDKLLIDLLNEFSQNNHDITVSEPAFTELTDYKDSVLAELKIGRNIDIFAVPELGMQGFLKTGLLRSIDSYFTAEPSGQDFYKEALDYFRDEDGKLYGLPRYVNSYALIYDKDAFKDAGYDTIPDRWEDFEIALRRLSNPEQKRYGLCIPNELFTWILFYYQSGNASLTELSPSQAERAADRLTRLYHDGLATNPSRLGLQSCTEALSTQRAASVIGDQRMFNAVRSPNIGTSVIPGAANGATLMFVEGYVMSSQTVYSADAWKFMAHLTSDNALKRWQGATGVLPPRRKLAEQSAKDDPALEPFVRGLEDAKGSELASISDRGLAALANTVSQLVSGELSKEQFVEQLQIEDLQQ